MDTASEEMSYEVQDYQTDTSAAEVVPFARPRRAVTLKKDSEAVNLSTAERARRVHPVPTSTSSNNRIKGPLIRLEKSEVS